MNKTAIRNFAVWARVSLIESIKQKAYEYEITESAQLDANASSVGGRLLTSEEKAQRKELVNQIKLKGYTQVMEEVAYTWFNRFIALRFMEVNNYLPSRVRVFTDENGDFKPEILKEAMNVELEGLDKSYVLSLLDKSNTDELYKYLIITQCNSLSSGLPGMFEKISNYTELLFPNNILRNDSVIAHLVNDIPNDDWLDAVQIIGWMYQFYNIEPKAAVFGRKSGTKMKKEDIPAATQLFTPEWIVKYLVENSIGRYFIVNSGRWLSDSMTEAERVAKEKEVADSFGWKYYLPEAEQTEEVRRQLITSYSSQATEFNVKNIKFIDPCMGSGHILVYAFEVLMKIYVACGWTERDAARSIVENNIYGLDIDDRAAQLAYFAVMMKARGYNRRILTSGTVETNIMSIQDSSGISDNMVAYLGRFSDVKTELEIKELIRIFADAKEIGSALNLPKINLEHIDDCINRFMNADVTDLLGLTYKEAIVNKLIPMVKLAKIMSQKYDVVTTNPPYMAPNTCGVALENYVKKNYPDSKTDMFAVFIEKCGDMLKKNGYQAMITMHSWMFLSSYEKLRAKMLYRDTINMVHLGARAFEEIGGEVVQTTAWVMSNSLNESYKATYCRLIEPNTQQGKEDMFLAGENRYETTQSNFTKIPGSPIAYWVSENVFSSFSQKNIGEYIVTREGMATANNDLFLRLWYELRFSCISFDSNINKKWFPYNKGGEFRKWYGNNDYVVNWENDGFQIKNNKDDKTGRIRSHNYNGEYAFIEGATWSALSSGSISLRYCPSGFLFDSKGAKGFVKDKMKIEYFISLVNSNVSSMYLSFFSPTIDFKVGDVILIPVFEGNINNVNIISFANRNIEISKSDWDSYETSWDFKKHPLL